MGLPLAFIPASAPRDTDFHTPLREHAKWPALEGLYEH